MISTPKIFLSRMVILRKVAAPFPAWRFLLVRIAFPDRWAPLVGWVRIAPALHISAKIAFHSAVSPLLHWRVRFSALLGRGVALLPRPILALLEQRLRSLCFFRFLRDLGANFFIFEQRLFLGAPFLEGVVLILLELT